MKMLTRPFGRALLGALFLLLGTVAPANATSVLPLDLDRIVKGAAVAFQGTVTDVHAERDAQSGFIVTSVTFHVDDALKGPVGSTYTLKQIGGKLATGEAYRVDGVPSYAPGEGYVIFLTGPSSIGLSSPVGLSQGKFTVNPGAAGLEVSNGRDFREMTANLPAASLPPGLQARLSTAPGAKVRSMGLDEFKQLVRQRVGAP